MSLSATAAIIHPPLLLLLFSMLIPTCNQQSELIHCTPTRAQQQRARGAQPSRPSGIRQAEDAHSHVRHMPFIALRAGSSAAEALKSEQSIHVIEIVLRPATARSTTYRH